MRQIFSIRFFAAVAAVVGLFFLLTTIFATREVIDGEDGGDAAVQLRRIDLVEQVFASTNGSFGLERERARVGDRCFVLVIVRASGEHSQRAEEKRSTKLPSGTVCSDR